MKQRKIKLLRQSQDLDLHELPKFSYSRKRREERGEEKESGGGDIGRSFGVYWPEGRSKSWPRFIPPYSPGDGWTSCEADSSATLSLLFRRGKYLIPRPRGKTGYCQCWQRPGPAIPHRGGGMCVWALEAASIHTLLGNLISTKKLI